MGIEGLTLVHSFFLGGCILGRSIIWVCVLDSCDYSFYISNGAT